MNWSEHYAETSDIPMIHIGGWYDIFLAGTFQNFVELGKTKKAPQRILVGPWTHHGNTRPYAGDVSFGDQAAIADFDGDWHLRWFDHYLKGKATGAENDAPLRLFVMGPGRRTQGQGRPPLPRRLLAQTRTPGRSPARACSRGTSMADGTLRPAKPAGNDPGTTYTFDPAHPVPTVGGGSSARLKDGAYNQKGGPALSSIEGTGPAAPLARGRHRLRDRAARAGHGDHRSHQGHALCVHQPHRHRLHRQARRRLSAERRVARRVRLEPHGRDHPRSLPRHARPRRDARAGQGVSVHDRAIPHRERVQEGTPHPRRHLQQQLSPFRRQPQHR